MHLEKSLRRVNAKLLLHYCSPAEGRRVALCSRYNTHTSTYNMCVCTASMLYIILYSILITRSYFSLITKNRYATSSSYKYRVYTIYQIIGFWIQNFFFSIPGRLETETGIYPSTFYIFVNYFFFIFIPACSIVILEY